MLYRHLSMQTLIIRTEIYAFNPNGKPQLLRNFETICNFAYI